MIKYSYALVDGLPVHIDNVTEESRNLNKYACICCGEPMAAHIKGKRKRHFQHFRNTEHDYETYLHLTAKKIIKQAYELAVKNSQPVYVEYTENRLCTAHKLTTSIPCEMGKAINKFDVTQTHKEIYEEMTVGNFIPDLHLKSTRFEEIFIEIFVTHKCEIEKRNSKYKIIEIKVENENDLQKLYQLQFLTTSGNITFYNFSTKTVSKPFCEEDGNGCEMYSYYYVILTGASRYIMGYDTLGNIMCEIRFYESTKYVLRKEEEEDYNYTQSDILFHVLNELRNNYRLELKSCYECVHFYKKGNLSYPGEYLRCNKLMEDIAISKAISCQYYEVRRK